jgi:hypothetical protein
MNFADELQAHFDSKPHVGYYVNKAGQYASLDDVTLISHIEDNLYVGGCEEGIDLGDFFSHIFSLYMWESYKSDDATTQSVYKMYDTSEGVAIEDLNENPVPFYEVVDAISEALDEGGNVLVHCQAGINRSNLLTGAVLVKRGRTPSEAIALLREKRSDLVLANQTFEDYLMELEPGAK